MSHVMIYSVQLCWPHDSDFWHFGKWYTGWARKVTPLQLREYATYTAKRL